MLVVIRIAFGTQYDGQFGRRSFALACHSSHLQRLFSDGTTGSLLMNSLRCVVLLSYYCAMSNKIYVFALSGDRIKIDLVCLFLGFILSRMISPQVGFALIEQNVSPPRPNAVIRICEENTARKCRQISKKSARLPHGVWVISATSKKMQTTTIQRGLYLDFFLNPYSFMCVIFVIRE